MKDYFFVILCELNPYLIQILFKLTLFKEYIQKLVYIIEKSFYKSTNFWLDLL